MHGNEEPSPGTWIYCFLLSLFSLVGGVFCLYYGTANNLYRSEVTELCGFIIIGCGIAIVALTLFWSYAAFLFKKQIKKFRRLSKEERLSAGEVEFDKTQHEFIMKAEIKRKTCELVMIKIYLHKIRLIIVFSLLGALFAELIGTGMFWHTSSELNHRFRIIDNCFCKIETDGALSADMLTTYAHQLLKMCPMINDVGNPLICLSVFDPEALEFGNYTAFTLPCQKLSGEGVTDPSCEEWRRFWSWFKLFRLYLPFLVVMKVPIIFINSISSIIFQNPKKAMDEDDEKNDSWINLNTLSRSKTDPLLYYGNMCAPLQNIPPCEERLGPYGQEQSKNESASMHTEAAIGKKRLSTGPVVVKCPMPPPSDDLDNEERVEFRASYVENVCSTPMPSVVENTSSPDFEISQMVRITPIRPQPPNITIIDGDLSLRSRLSSFGPLKQCQEANGMMNYDHDDLPPPPPPPPVLEELYEGYQEERAHGTGGADNSRFGEWTPEIRRSRGMSVSSLNLGSPSEFRNSGPTPRSTRSMIFALPKLTSAPTLTPRQGTPSRFAVNDSDTESCRL